MAGLFKLAVRNLRRNRRRSAITLVALVFGVGVMVASRGFVNGIQRMMMDNLINGRMGAVQVHRTGYVKNVLGSPLTLDFADTPELRAKVASVPGVKAVSPRIEFGAMLSGPDKRPPPDDGTLLPEEDQGKSSFFLATAADPALEAKVTPRRLAWFKGGHPPSGPAAAEVALNDELAKGVELELHPDGAPVPPPEKMVALMAADRDGALNGENVMLSGVFAAGAPGDKRVGLVPLETAQRLLRMEGRVTEYALALERDEDAPRVQAQLQALLGPEFEVHSWQQLFPFIVEMLATQDWIFGLVTRVVLLAVLLGIINVMLMSVLERVREIGTMLAVGMRRWKVVSLFLLEGAVIGLVGGAIGVAVGTAVTLWLNHVGVPLPAPGATVESFVHPVLGSRQLVEALLQAVAGSTLAALWPALRASGLRPVEALASA